MPSAAAGMTTTRMTPTGVAAARPSTARTSTTRMPHSGPPAGMAHAGTSARMAAVSAAPAVVVPAVISSAEEELSLLHVTGHSRRRKAVDRHGASLAAEQGERNRGRGGIDPLSHETSPPFFD